MRDIKFRGQKIDLNEWVYGGISIFQHEATVFDCDCVVNSAYDVNPETVGQFTGLKDKNGVDIYEGDLLKTFGMIYQVVFSDGAFYMKLKSTHYRLCRIFIKQEEIEIVGNKHENPELLK